MRTHYDLHIHTRKRSTSPLCLSSPVTSDRTRAPQLQEAWAWEPPITFPQGDGNKGVLSRTPPYVPPPSLISFGETSISTPIKHKPEETRQRDGIIKNSHIPTGVIINTASTEPALITRLEWGPQYRKQGPALVGGAGRPCWSRWWLPERRAVWMPGLVVIGFPMTLALRGELFRFGVLLRVRFLDVGFAWEMSYYLLFWWRQLMVVGLVLLLSLLFYFINFWNAIYT